MSNFRPRAPYQRIASYNGQTGEVDIGELRPNDGLSRQDTLKRSVHEFASYIDETFTLPEPFFEVESILDYPSSNVHYNDSGTNSLVQSLSRRPLDPSSERCHKLAAQDFRTGPLPVSSPKPRYLVTASGWWKELVAMTLSVVCIASIAKVLLSIKDRPLSSWDFRYSPNSVISQLMTLSRSALMLSTASCIGQSTWHHLQARPRNLYELQALDEASRGPWGALRLFARADRFGTAAWLGCSITQQILACSSRIEFGPSNGTYPITQVYRPPVPNGYDDCKFFLYIEEQRVTELQDYVITALNAGTMTRYDKKSQHRGDG
jgi:hypothetical protein